LRAERTLDADTIAQARAEAIRLVDWRSCGHDGERWHVEWITDDAGNDYYPEG